MRLRTALLLFAAFADGFFAFGLCERFLSFCGDFCDSAFLQENGKKREFCEAKNGKKWKFRGRFVLAIGAIFTKKDAKNKRKKKQIDKGGSGANGGAEWRL